MLQKLEALRAVPMLRRLDDATIRAVLDRCIEQVYLRNQTVFLEGTPSKGLLVVWRGAVKVYKLGEAGREQIIEIEGPGHSVAELPLLDGLPYPASCAAMEDSVLLVVPAADFHRLLDRHPAISRAIVASLSMRLRRMVGLVEELSLKAVRERLADLLVELSEGRDSFELPWTHQEIAARIGTVREIVSRTIGRLVAEEAIRLEGRRVTILDRNRL